MNKILMDNNSLILDKKLNDVVVDIKNSCNLNIINANNLKMIINIQENSKLLLNIFKIVNKIDNLNIVINSYQNSILETNYSFLASEKTNIKIVNNILSDDITSNININGVNINNGEILISVEGNINKNIKDNVFNENVKVLTLNDKNIIIKPDMLVSSNEVIANHNTTIGGVDTSSLFYLMSKGLSQEKSINLIKNGFLINNLKVNQTLLNNIKEQLLNWR